MAIEGVAWKIGGRMGVEGKPPLNAGDRSVFQSDFKNLGRLDPLSRAVASVLALLLGDAGLYPSDSKLNIPLMISSESGFSLSDAEYFRDFLEFGETAGRANKFIYTLPTSPLADASVHFRLTGGLAYLEASYASPWNTLVEAAEDKFAFSALDDAPIDKCLLLVAEEGADYADVVAALVSNSGDSSTADLAPPKRLAFLSAAGRANR